MHRPADLHAVEAMLQDLAEVIDESPEVVRARLREVVPEYATEPGSPPTALPAEELRKARAK
jgi:hypothetical protein